MTETATLICPKCRGQMHSYERNGVVIDQCDECRGIFLDRGELEQLMDAGSTPSRLRRGEDEHEDSEDQGHGRDHEHGRFGDRGGKPRRRMSTLLEDFLGGGE